MDWFLAAIGLVVIAFFIGGAFALGMALICKALKWAPINVSVIVNQNDGK